MKSSKPLVSLDVSNSDGFKSWLISADRNNEAMQIFCNCHNLSPIKIAVLHEAIG